MTKLITAAGLFALPLAAIATPTTTERFLVDVEIWGEISSANGGDWSVGDTLHHTLTIDTALAPPFFMDGPSGGDYRWNPLCDRACPPRVPAPSGFVKTRGATFTGTSDDFVNVLDGYPSTGSVSQDSFFLGDSEYSLDASGNRVKSFDLSASSSAGADFIHGPGLVQSFDTASLADGTLRDGFGFISTFANGVRQTAQFLVTRMRATPRSCSP